MKIISVYSSKGGVGKSVTAVNLSYLLSKRGFKVVLWDIDPQGASSFYLRIKQKLKGKVEKVITEFERFDLNIKESDYENLYVLPSDLKLKDIDLVIEKLKKSSKKVEKTLKKGVINPDFIIIDSPPGFTNINSLIAEISDIVLVPVIPTVLSVRSLKMLKNFFGMENINTNKIYPFFSMADLRKNIHKEILEKYSEKLRIKSIIPYSSEIEKMGVYLQPTGVYGRSSYIRDIYEKFADEVVEICKIIKK
ncbi:MAG: chromosome partitioning protein [Deferribacteres bacterium]|jgi:cellulose biosynthesis protein BcsQ|nr:ATPase involved in chromosome partitioning [Deferribacteraceae bacterium]MDK2791332.1 chromosome partitioning protein [Deferribacteres bacterium]